MRTPRGMVPAGVVVRRPGTSGDRILFVPAPDQPVTPRVKLWHRVVFGVLYATAALKGPRK